MWADNLDIAINWIGSQFYGTPMFYFGIHLAISLCFFLFRRTHKERALCESLIVLCLPGIGILLIIIGEIFYHKSFAKGNVLPDYPDQEDLLFMESTAVDGNILPFQDVLLLDDNKTKRILLTNILKTDALQVAGNLTEALRDQDSEVSHYAATAIMNKRLIYEAELRELEKQAREQPDNEIILLQKIDKIKEYLDSKLLDRYMQNRYRNRYSQALEDIISVGKAQKQHYLDKFNLEIIRGNIAKAKVYADYYQEKFPQDENASLMMIQLYYVMGNAKMIREKVKEMKASDITFSPKGLEIVRYWSGI